MDAADNSMDFTDGVVFAAEHPAGMLLEDKRLRSPSICILMLMHNPSLQTTNRFLRNIHSLTYPREQVSIGIMAESDSIASQERSYAMAAALGKSFRRVVLYHQNYKLPAEQLSAERLSKTAKARNFLLMRALQDEDYVLWLDGDAIWSHPADIIETLLATEKDIVVPNCVTEPNGSSYDRKVRVVCGACGGVGWVWCVGCVWCVPLHNVLHDVLTAAMTICHYHYLPLPSPSAITITITICSLGWPPKQTPRVLARVLAPCPSLRRLETSAALRGDKLRGAKRRGRGRRWRTNCAR
jgi:hypothetical protein